MAKVYKREIAIEGTKKTLSRFNKDLPAIQCGEINLFYDSFRMTVTVTDKQQRQSVEGWCACNNVLCRVLPLVLDGPLLKCRDWVVAKRGEDGRAQLVKSVRRVTATRAFWSSNKDDYVPIMNPVATPEEIADAEAYREVLEAEHGRQREQAEKERQEQRQKEAAERLARDPLEYYNNEFQGEMNWDRLPLEQLQQIAKWLDEAYEKGK